jgi:hypothetical protein
MTGTAKTGKYDTYWSWSTLEGGNARALPTSGHTLRTSFGEVPTISVAGERGGAFGSEIELAPCLSVPSRS